jgi:cupin fold WbuC family metalloprotein
MNVRRFGPAFFNDLAVQAEASPRLRQHANLHVSYEETCQRLFNAIGLDSYIRPHRHLSDSKTETLLAVRGVMTLVLFDEQGAVQQAIRFGNESNLMNCDMGVELSPGVWHTVIAEAPGAVLFEVKAGPFDPAKAKEWAPWAPEEGSQDAAQYLIELKKSLLYLT